MIDSVPTVDAHAHFVPEVLVEAILAGTHGIDEISINHDNDGRERWLFGKGADGKPWEIRRFPPVLTDLVQRLTWMDTQRIDVQYVSIWGEMHAYHLSPENSTRWARLINETLKEAVGDQSRIRALGSLPLGSPDLAAAELRWAAKAGFHGIMCGVHSGGFALSDSDVDPLWEAASETGLFVYLHPDFPHWNPRIGGELVGNSIGRSVDTALALARMISEGVFARFPELKVIATHGGGGFPFLWPRFRHGLTLASSEYASDLIPAGLTFDTVVHDPTALRFLIEILGPGRLVFGSDYPLPLGDPNPYDTLVAASGVTDVRDIILGGTIARLIAE